MLNVAELENPMKRHKKNYLLRISLAALALGASGLLVYQTIQSSGKSDPVSAANGRLSPRDRGQLTPHQGTTPDSAAEIASQDLSSRPPAPHVFHEFNDWAVQYSKATPAEQQEMLAHGETMVKQRHEQMAGLIEKSPQVALDESDALSPFAREALPESLQAQLEQRVNARGDIRVMACLGKDVAPYIRTAIFDGNDYTFYPATENEMTWPESDRSLLGITLAVNRVGTDKDGKQYPRVDKLMALRKDRVRVLSTEEAAIAAKSRKKGADSICEVSKKSIEGTPVPAAIETGGGTKFLCEPAHTTPWLQSPAGVAAAGTPNRFLALGGPGEGSGSFPSLSNAATTGQLTCLVAKFRCSDQATYNDDVSQARMDPMFTQLASWSNNSATFAPTYIPEVLPLPGTSSQYFNLQRSIRTDATAALNAWTAQRGTTLSSYRFHVVCVKDAMNGIAGGADLTGQYVEISQTENRVFQHEIGHILGLPHANFWNPSTINPIGNGVFQEYKGAYSTMADLNMDWATFNAMERYYMRWLPVSQTHDTTSRVSGVYMIYDPEVTSLNPSRQYTIRIPRSDGAFYFVEYRPRATALAGNGPVNATTQDGIRILRSSDAAQLDLTPLSAGDARDGALVVGKEFYDPAENLTIRPIAKGGVGQDQYFQIQITFGVPTLAKGRTYILRSREGNLTMGVANSATNNTAAVTRQDFQGTPNQKWVLMSDGGSSYKILNANSGKALTVSDYSTQNFGTIQQYEYVGSNSQRWQIVSTGGGYFKLINNNSNKTLSNQAPYTDAGAQLTQYQDLNSINQWWSFQEVSPLNSGSNYIIASRKSGKVLDVAGSENTNGTPIYQWTQMPYAPYQKWTASAQGGSQQAFTNVGSQKVLEVGGFSMANAARVQQWDWAFHSWQKWILQATDQDTSGIWYQMVNVGSGKVADVSGASVSNGATIQQYSPWSGYNQQWRFTVAP